MIFLGTLPGLLFDTPAYYTIEEKKRRSVTGFLNTLLRELGLRPLVNPDPNLEVILRQTDEKDLLMGLVHRGKGGTFDLSLNLMASLEQAELLYSSDAENKLHKANYHQLRVEMAEDGVMVVRFAGARA